MEYWNIEIMELVSHIIYTFQSSIIPTFRTEYKSW